MNILESHLSEEQKEVAGLVKDIQCSLPASASAKTDALLEVLLESGIWSIGMDENIGGGGADFELRIAALLQLATTHADVAWAVAQAHAVADILAGHSEFAALAASVADGSASVFLADQDSESVSLFLKDGRITGSLSRIDLAQDASAVPAHIVILTGIDTALVLPPEALQEVHTVERTGFSGLYSVRATVNIRFDMATQLIESTANNQVRCTLAQAGAAIAAGISQSAVAQSHEYAQNRVQFGAPLINIPMVRAVLSSQQAEADTSVAVILGQPNVPLEFAAAALEGNCQRALSVTASALQSHGGYGYLKEFDIEHLVRDAVSLRAASSVLSLTRRVAETREGAFAGKDIAFFAKEEVAV